MSKPTSHDPQSESPPVDGPEGFAKRGQLEKQQANLNQTEAAPQAVFSAHQGADEADTLARLEMAFKRAGGALYHLCDGTFLAVRGSGGAALSCPDRRAACALLRALGG